MLRTMSDEEEQIKALNKCMAFNRVTPVGTLCLYWPVRRQDGSFDRDFAPRLARSRSIAEVRSGYPVVFLEGISGFLHCSHIESEGHINLKLACARRALEQYPGESFMTKIMKAMHDFDDALDPGSPYDNASVGRYFGMLLQKRNTGGTIPLGPIRGQAREYPVTDPWGRERPS